MPWQSGAGTSTARAARRAPTTCSPPSSSLLRWRKPRWPWAAEPARPSCSSTRPSPARPRSALSCPRWQTPSAPPPRASCPASPPSCRPLTRWTAAVAAGAGSTLPSPNLPTRSPGGPWTREPLPCCPPGGSQATGKLSWLASSSPGGAGDPASRLESGQTRPPRTVSVVWRDCNVTRKLFDLCPVRLQKYPSFGLFSKLCIQTSSLFAAPHFIAFHACLDQLTFLSIQPACVVHLWPMILISLEPWIVLDPRFLVLYIDHGSPCNGSSTCCTPLVYIPWLFNSYCLNLLNN